MELDHWHPVLRAGSLARGPVGITVCGQELVVFRGASGAVHALEDRCPHRRMRLSAGWVEDEQLVCPYHGWRFTGDGTGSSPGTPRLRPCVARFDVAERDGLVWVRNAGSPSPMPVLDLPGYRLACTLEHRFDAPLELVVDIFAEVEHAPTSHTFFGHAMDEVDAVEPHFDFSAEDRIDLLTVSPQRPLPRIVEALFGVRSGDPFHNHLTMRFAPVHHVYELQWFDRDTGRARPERLASVFFFNPVDAERTQCMSLHYLRAPRWGTAFFELLGKRVLARIMDHEIRRDAWVLERLADKRPGLEKLHLGRFDRILVEHRRRIARIYRGCDGRGEAPPRTRAATADPLPRARRSGAARHRRTARGLEATEGTR